MTGLQQCITASGKPSEDLPLFRALSTLRFSTKFRRESISYSKVREIAKNPFKAFTDVFHVSSLKTEERLTAVAKDIFFALTFG